MRTVKFIAWGLVVSLIVACGAGLSRATVAKVEEPKFTVELSDGAYQVRRYGERVVAETVVVGDRKAAETEGFKRLAGYIFGGNGQSSKIAMTAPVGQRAEGRTIAMTAPVSQKADKADGNRWVVAFTMPEGESLTTLPQPNDSRVTLRTRPALRVAVAKFSGRWTDESFREHTAELRSWLSKRALGTADEAVEVNRYDPPWTPWFLRRNEVWLTLM